MSEQVELMDEKEALLGEVGQIFEEPKNFSLTWLIMTLVIFFLVLMIVFPKIYLKNQIYFESKKIHKLEKEVIILRDENDLLKSKIEHLRFKNQVLDTLFDEEY